MSSHYQELYQKRRNFDPFSCRATIDCRTALEDIFAAFMGELIERITKNTPYNWEMTYIYKPSVKDARNAMQNGKNYSPYMILSNDELDKLLKKPLSSYSSTDSHFDVARNITERFADITLSIDGLIKLARKLLNPDLRQNFNHFKRRNCHQNYPDDIQAISDMFDAILEVRNPSSHRGIDPSNVPMEIICDNAKLAYTQICNTLPLIKNIFYKFTNADAQHLQNQYCPLLLRVLDALDKKLNKVECDFSKDKIHYTDLSGYKIFLDESALASGHIVTLNKLTDELEVVIFEDSLTSVTKATTNPDATIKMVAQNALSTFRMSKKNLLILKNRKDTDQESILDVLKHNPDDKLFVVTENRSFAQQILALNNPSHVAGYICNNRGEFIIYRSENLNG